MQQQNVILCKQQSREKPRLFSFTYYRAARTAPAVTKLRITIHRASFRWSQSAVRYGAGGTAFYNIFLVEFLSILVYDERKTTGGIDMNTQQITVTIISTLLSGLLAAIITICINKRSEKLRLKQNLVMDLFGYRYQVLGNKSQTIDINSKGFAKALNCVPIVFHKDKKVLEACDNFYNALAIADKNERSNKSQEALIVLMKALCKAAKIDCVEWNDSRFEKTFDI